MSSLDVIKPFYSLLPQVANPEKRLGFKEIMSIPEATFYVMFTNKNESEYIYDIVEQFKKWKL